MRTHQTNLQGCILLSMRLVVALIFLWHAVPKALYLAWSMEKFVGFGLPGFLGPIVGWIEVIAAVCLILGFWNTWTNLLLAALILGAIVSVQLPKGIQAGLERDVLILASTLALSLFGPGALALDSKRQQAADASLATSGTAVP